MSSPGETIQKYLKQHDEISIRNLARKAGISHSHLTSIMKGVNKEGQKIEPSMGTLIKIADAMNMPLVDFLVKSGYVKESDVNYFVGRKDLEKILPPEYHHLLDAEKIKYIHVVNEMEKKGISPEKIEQLVQILTTSDKL